MKTKFLTLFTLLFAVLMLGGAILNKVYAQENYYPCTGGTYQYDDRIIQVKGPGPTQVNDAGLSITFGNVPGEYELFFEHGDHFEVTLFRNQAFPYQLTVAGNLCQGYVDVTMAGSDPSVYYYVKKANGDEIGGTVRQDRGPITWGITEPGTYQVYAFMDFYTCSDQDRQLVGSFTVQPAQPLIVNAGADQNILLPPNNIILTGSANPPACSISYTWSKQSGPSVTMGNVNTSSLTLTNIIPGPYTFRLTCTSGNLTAFDDVKVTAVELTPLQKDSLALVALYNATDGPNWYWSTRPNPKWLKTAISTWNGVTIRDGRVFRLNLEGFLIKGNIPASFGNLTALTELRLANNKIESLPEDIGKLINVDWFDVKRNLLTALPSSIVNLTKLTRIYADYNKITSIPGSLSSLTNIFEITLSNNLIQDFTPVTTCPNVNYLTLTSNKIKRIPDEIMNMKFLLHLNLERNEVSYISPKIGQVKTLSQLLLTSNKIESIPQEVGSLNDLITLKLDSNKVQKVSFLIGSFPRLVDLNLSNNFISEIPSNFLINANPSRKVNLSNNRLDFGDLEPLSSNIDSKVVYAPQDSLVLNYNRTSKRLEINFNTPFSKYQWKRNGIIVQGDTTFSSKITEAQYIANDAYQCKITNSKLPSLTLYTKVKRPKEGSQSNGDFVSKASGNWNNYTTWKRFVEGKYIDALPGEYPGENNSVFIEKGHTITLVENSKCMSLHLNVTADVIRLNTKENILEVYGKLRLYTGTAPGMHSTSAGIPGWISTGTNGKLRLKGQTNRVITEQDEFSDHVNMRGWTLEVNMSEEATGVLNSPFRANDVVILSGRLEIKSTSFKISKL